jgi:predicted TIM-barrel fold metal-dependent hydrolase
MTSSPSNQSPPLYDGPIVDAHVHYWNPRNTPREVSPLVKLLGWNLGLTNWMAKRIFPEAAILFFATPKYLTKNYLPDDYNAEFETTNQVKGIVHVEANWTGKDPVDETRWLESLQTNNASTILGIVSHVDLTLDLNSVEKILQSHKRLVLKYAVFAMPSCGIPTTKSCRLLHKSIDPDLTPFEPVFHFSRSTN